MQDLSLEKSRWSPGGRKLNSGVSRRYVSRYSTEDPERKNGAYCQVEISSPFHGVAALHVEGSSLAPPPCFHPLTLQQLLRETSPSLSIATTKVLIPQVLKLPKQEMGQ